MAKLSFSAAAAAMEMELRESECAQLRSAFISETTAPGAARPPGPKPGGLDQPLALAGDIALNQIIASPGLASNCAALP